MTDSASITNLPKYLQDALEDAVRESKSAGAVAYVGDLEHTFFHGAVGYRQIEPRQDAVDRDTVYDLASITKVMATAPAVLLLNEDGLVDLDAPVSSYLPIAEFGRFTVRHCLTHSSGLVALMPYYKEENSVDGMLARYAELPLKFAPGTRWLYSDTGFMILGRIVETVSGKTLDKFCSERMYTPLNLSRTTFKPPASWRNSIAATEKCPWRKQMMLGEVHDENAFAVGGVAGHAGLFSNAKDVATYVRALLSGKILKPETLDNALRFGYIPAWAWQGLGWQLDGWSTKNFGFLTTRSSFGHVGWTGTSVWADRTSGRFAILLSNTCHPTRTSRDNATLREKYYGGVCRALFPTYTNTHTGLDRLMREDFEPLRGKRIALLTHHAAVDQFGRSIFDVFKLAPDITIAMVYSPEHGVLGQAEAGEHVGSQDAAFPIVSLYGNRKAPSKEELKGVDYFVIDLQDVGARYYTYAATMKACMQVCAESELPVLVLDRPNPVGGDVLEGPIAEWTDSLVCWGAVPIRHGMTLGELAIYFQKTEFSKSSLKVMINSLDGWEARRHFDECSLKWVPPSPNLPTAESALVYGGTCLFEGVNINEGRGTDAPFQLIGAPWINATKVVERVGSEAASGFQLRPVVYEPRSIPGKATAPRYLGTQCNGLQITVADRIKARPFQLAVSLLCAIQAEHPRKLEWERNFDVLAGSSTLREAIVTGAQPSDIESRIRGALDRFDLERPKFYVSSGPARTT